MAQKATLTIDGIDYDVQSLDYKIERQLDKETGKPYSQPKGGEVTFTILVSKKDDEMFHGWITGLTHKDGIIKLPIVERTTLQEHEFEFKEALCTSLNVNYISYGDKQLTMKMTIHAKKLLFSKVLIINEVMTKEEDDKIKKDAKEKADAEAKAKADAEAKAKKAKK